VGTTPSIDPSITYIERYITPDIKREMEPRIHREREIEHRVRDREIKHRVRDRDRDRTPDIEKDRRPDM
jgi:hypothetical protein